MPSWLALEFVIAVPSGGDCGGSPSSMSTSSVSRDTSWTVVVAKAGPMPGDAVTS
jgi:hypothetical protein